MSAGFKGGTLSQYIRLGVIKEDIHYQLHVCSSPKRFMYLLPPINLIIRDSQGHTRTHKDTHTHTHMRELAGVATAEKNSLLTTINEKR